MANFNKIIKVLNIKSAVSLQCTSARDAIETTHSIALESINNLTADFIFKTFIILLKLAIRT